MATQDYKRKLTAILSADVKGYSRLMGEDEEATVRTITAHREVITEIVQKHRGRVVDSPGDNILAEFASVVDAVRCAVEIQEELKVRNAELPENRRMEFRIGVNLGDVIHEQERIYGDGVNVAARVESLADAGGICISRSAYDQVKNKLTLGYDNLGEYSVKNIAEPVQIYKVLMDPESVGRVIGEKKVEPKRGQRVAIAAVIALLLVVGGAVLWKSYQPTVSPPVEVASEKKMALPLPDKPSLAVLPFENMSGDPEQEYFSDGITEDLITDLSKISGLFVIARNSTFTYKGKPVRVQQVAENLGVRYVLEGSVRKAGEKVRINAQLVDATTGHHLWAERFDGTFGDIFALQDRFTRKIVAALALRLTADEQKKLTFRYTDNLEAYDAYLKGREHFFAGTPEDFVKAVGYFEKAIELDPNYSFAHAGLASVYQTSINRNLTKELGWPDARSRVQKHLQMAMKNPTPYAHYAVAKTRLYQRRYDEAIAEAERAIALDPNYQDGYFMMGWILIFAGRSSEAVDYIKKAMRLDPRYPGSHLYFLGLAQYFLERYDEAASSLERVLYELKMGGRPVMWLLAATYAHLGRQQEAEEVLTEYMKKRGYKGYTVERVLKIYLHAFKDPRDTERFAQGLHKAGLPME